jgi:hypothetical protein
MNWLFSTQGYLPMHLCGHWTPGLLWTYVFSEGSLWAAYTLIALVLLIYWKQQRTRLPFPWIALLFALCFTLCGLTHLGEVIACWVPAYRFFGLVKLLAAFVSLATAGAVLRIAPEAFETFSVRMRDLRQMAELAHRACETEQTLRAENSLLRKLLAQREPNDGRVCGTRCTTDISLSG